MSTIPRIVVPLMTLAAASTAGLQAQGAPAGPPNRLTAFIEQIKPGMEAEHEANEAGWPAANAKAGSPYYYLALESITGPSEVWYVSTFASYAEEGESMKLSSTNPDLSAETARLWKADAQYLNSTTAIQAIGRPDLSYGGGADITRNRFWEITSFRVRVGHEAGFEAAAKTYVAAARRLTPDVSFRTYQVVAGMNGSNYMVFSSVDAYADFDQTMAADNAVMAGMN